MQTSTAVAAKQQVQLAAKEAEGGRRRALDGRCHGRCVVKVFAAGQGKAGNREGRGGKRQAARGRTASERRRRCIIASAQQPLLSFHPSLFSAHQHRHECHTTKSRSAAKRKSFQTMPPKRGSPGAEPRFGSSVPTHSSTSACRARRRLMHHHHPTPPTTTMVAVVDDGHTDTHSLTRGECGRVSEWVNVSRFRIKSKFRYYHLLTVEFTLIGLIDCDVLSNCCAIMP